MAIEGGDSDYSQDCLARSHLTRCRLYCRWMRWRCPICERYGRAGGVKSSNPHAAQRHSKL
eukprot:759654-Hanusia_phi.AAC.2